MRRRLWWAGLLALAAVVYLGYSGWQGAALYYLTPAEAQERLSSLSGRNFRLAGNVAGEVAWDPGTRLLEFRVTDGAAAVPVLYRGAPPDNFGPGRQVVVEGTADEQGKVLATRLLLKCPSKYEEAPASARGVPPGALYLGGAAGALALGLVAVVSRRLGGRMGKQA